MDQKENSGELISEKKVKGSSPFLVVFLILLVIVLSCAVAYFLLRDKDISFFCTKAEECITEEAEEEPKGFFHAEFSYPSEYLPAHRVCFNKVDDISDVHCFVSEGLSYESGELVQPDTHDYAHELVDGSGSLPVGKYTMTYGEWRQLNSYVWNPCVKALNGSGDTDESVCNAFYQKLERAYNDNDFYNFDLGYINSFGGDPIVIEIKEGETTEIGSVPLQPYISFNPDTDY